MRRASGQSCEAFVTALAQAEGIVEPSREQLARFDRKRKKTTSNRDWQHPHDPDSRVTKMEDGRTYLAHEVQHAVDLDSGALLAVRLATADQGGATTLGVTFHEAQQPLQTIRNASVPEVVADKGYHSDAVLDEMHELGVGTCIVRRGFKLPRAVPHTGVRGRGGARPRRRLNGLASCTTTWSDGTSV